MNFAINVPNFGDYADPRMTAELAQRAEQAGWDGFFVWDHVNAAFEPGAPMADPWMVLTAVALATERIRIGTMVTPLPRRRPWKVARETVTLDRLSGGRLILGVGLGSPPDLEYAAFGEDGDLETLARKLDEGLAVLDGLWTGQPFTYHGDHYDVIDVRFTPTSVQKPRIPIWVAQMYPHTGPLKRAARWDGLVPMHETEMVPSPDHVAESVEAIVAIRGTTDGFDVCVPVVTSDDRTGPAGLVAEYAAAGATWIMVGAWSPESLRRVIGHGPPQ
jgi:alkanesulfonate monooxygenase SsuD/methylene tetrahydromethanopterin reductase-like flavin-dependent oxidoreductase (luciferase family)